MKYDDKMKYKCDRCHKEFTITASDHKHLYNSYTMLCTKVEQVPVTPLTLINSLVKCCESPSIKFIG